VAGTQALLVQGGAWGALVFRGTQVGSGSLGETITDLTANARVCPREWAGPGRAHAGYATALARVHEPALETARRLAQAVPIYVAGHSLGGALATLYAARVAVAQAHQIAGLVTLGAPAPATPAAYSQLRARVPVRRYVLRGDWAPAWPPGYAHPAPASRLTPPDDVALAGHGVGGYVAAV